MRHDLEEMRVEVLREVEVILFVLQHDQSKLSDEQRNVLTRVVLTKVEQLGGINK